jgi:diguanylate cyclase (GGDEF)-like protein
LIAPNFSLEVRGMARMFGTSEQQLIDAEIDQASTRIIVVAALLAFVSIINICIIRFGKMTFNDYVCQVLFIVSFLFTMGLSIHQYYRPRLAHERIIVGMIHDVLVTTTFLLFSREKFASFLFIYPWISIGHGFRFGERYLFIASLFTSFGMLILFKVSTYWSAMVPSGLDIGLIFVLVASYTGYLLRDLSQIKEVLKQLATRDPLTGLANRRIIEDQLPHMVAVHQEQNLSMGMIYFDLDGFKPVNDILGHDNGDQLLKQIATMIKKSVRSDDIVARVGGDEFVVVLNRIENEKALATRGRQILTLIESIKSLNGKKIEISASLGCLLIGAKTPKELSSSQKLIREADRLMYASKKSGRGVLSLARTEDLWTVQAAA